MIEKKTCYFEKPGKENTNACLEIVRKAVREGNCRHLIVASTTGSSGLLFSEAFRENGLNLVVVTHLVTERISTWPFSIRCRPSMT